MTLVEIELTEDQIRYVADIACAVQRECYEVESNVPES